LQAKGVQPVERPNIIIVTCHDLGDYIPCYGTPVTAPNLEAMAAQGVVFENHFSTATVCSPSRGSIMTGCYPHTDGLMGLVHRGWELDVDNCPALPTLLREAGYETHLFGFQHEHWDPGRLGYDHIHRGKGLHCDQVVPLLTEWLRARGEGDQPFLAGVGFSETHRIGLMPSGFKRDAYQPADPSEVRVRPSMPDIPEIREDLADFYGAIKLVDTMMGQLLRTLDDAGLSDSTLLVFTSDHGASFMHAKATLYDGGTKVACLLRWPQALPQGLRVQALTSHVDILPTILDLLGLPVLAHIEGRSFAAAARGEPGPERKYAFSEKTYTNYYDPGRTVRSRSFRYIRKGLRTCIFDFIIPELELCTFDYRRTPEVFRYYSARRCTDELYDLTADPGEIENLVDDPAHKPVLEELSSALDAHLETTNDPFRHLRNDLLMPEEAYESIASVRWG
jgi:N-sulfoglucosamine sulfohydrolase